MNENTKMKTDVEKICRPFLDEEGKVRQLPAKGEKKRLILTYLAEKFQIDKDYTEQEVNEVVAFWSTLGDFYLLRRELIDAGYLGRTDNGARYWRNKSE